MDLNKMFKLTEDTKILNEISEMSTYMKDIEMYVNYGYAKGIAETLKLIKQGEELEGKEIYEVIIKGFSDNDDIGNMVKRLLKD